MSNLPPGAEYDSKAPFNEEDMYCTECNSVFLEIVDYGIYKGKEWTSYKCTICDTSINNEPDYE